MNKVNIFQYLFRKSRFYFFAVLFFIQILWLRIRGKYVKYEVLPSSPDEQWLEEGEVKITPKPPQAKAMANKAKLGLSQVPEKYRTHVIVGISILVFFQLFGIGNFIYWLTLIIKAYHFVGWILLYALTICILYLIIKYEYYYFQQRRYEKVINIIKLSWEEAKQKSILKFQY